MISNKFLAYSFPFSISCSIGLALGSTDISCGLSSLSNSLILTKYLSSIIVPSRIFLQISSSFLHGEFSAFIPAVVIVFNNSCGLFPNADLIASKIIDVFHS